MPGETGLDFLKYVRSRPEYATVPFILQTTENDKKKIVEAVKSGVQGYLIKPVQKNALAQKMLELSTVYKFQPPSMAMPPKPVAAGKINAGPSVPGETGFRPVASGVRLSVGPAGLRLFMRSENRGRGAAVGVHRQ
jgi:hypothetical protein